MSKIQDMRNDFRFPKSSTQNTN